MDIVIFGEDADGNLYYVDYNGEVYQVLAVPAIEDVNENGVVELDDFVLLKSRFGVSGVDVIGDLDQSGIVDLADFALLKTHFGEDSREQASDAVPEPSTAVACLACIVVLAAFTTYSSRARAAGQRLQHLLVSPEPQPEQAAEKGEEENEVKPDHCQRIGRPKPIGAV